MLANGLVFPYVEVEPRRYRFRILNVCNTRFLSLKLVCSMGKKFPDTAEPDVNNPGPVMQLIGTEGGFLDPVANPQGVLFPNTKTAPGLVLAPAERADLIIDFSKVKPGQFLILHNDAPVPFPGGTPLADFYPGNNKLAVPPLPGFGPNTRTLLQFQVVPLSGGAEPAPPAGWSLPAMDPAPLVPAGVMTPPPGVRVRDLTLNEVIDEYGRLAQELGDLTPKPAPAVGFGLPYNAPATETPAVNDIEVWRIFNLTADAHPIHFHLVNVQILSRQAFNVNQFAGVPNFIGNPRPPDPDEMGWKETVRMYPGECTTVIMKFELPPNPVIPISGMPTEVPVPLSARPGAGGGHEYVWHCHILEHEEHDMMRPLVVMPPAP